MKGTQPKRRRRERPVRVTVAILRPDLRAIDEVARTQETTRDAVLARILHFGAINETLAEFYRAGLYAADALKAAPPNAGN